MAAQTPRTFSQSLAPAAWTSVGFSKLTAAQTAALDALIQHDVQSARQGDVVAFAKSFTARRTPEEFKRAGLDRLTAAERAKLDDLVAAEVAKRPTEAFMPYVPNAITTQAIEEMKPKLQVHGDVSMFVGSTSHRGSFYGGSFDAYVVDPAHRFSLSVGMAQVRGKGAPACFDGFGGPGW